MPCEWTVEAIVYTMMGMPKNIIFFLGLQGFRQDLGFQELGGTIKKTPQKIFFSPQKRSSRASRAPPCRPQSGEAKGAPGLIAAMSSFTAVLSGRGGSFGGRGWKLTR